MTVVSSFIAADMDPEQAELRGRRRCCAATFSTRNRAADLGDRASPSPTLNPFELDVRDALITAGIPLDRQYGSRGYWIDFAAQHPSGPGGSCSRSSATAPATTPSAPRATGTGSVKSNSSGSAGVSTASGRRTGSSIARPRSNGRLRLTAGSGPRSTMITVSSSCRAGNSIPAAAPNGRTESCPITTHRDGIDDYTDYELVEVVRWIESDTLLRTEEELPRGDDASARSSARRGKKITAAIENAIGLARNPGFRSTGRYGDRAVASATFAAPCSRRALRIPPPATRNRNRRVVWARLSPWSVGTIWAGRRLSARRGAMPSGCFLPPASNSHSDSRMPNALQWPRTWSCSRRGECRSVERGRTSNAYDSGCATGGSLRVLVGVRSAEPGRSGSRHWVGRPSPAAPR